MFEISYLSLLPVYILKFFNTQIAFNLVAWDVSSVWGSHLNSSYMSISQEITFCSFFFPKPSAHNAHPSSHVKGNFIVLSSSHLVGSLPQVCKGVGAVLRPQSSAHGMVLFRGAIWLQTMGLDPGLLLHIPDSQWHFCAKQFRFFSWLVVFILQNESYGLYIIVENVHSKLHIL